MLPLPLEVLRPIFQQAQLSDRTLIVLADSDPLLSVTCLSIHLARHGITKPEQACTFRIPRKRSNHDVLTALSLARWLTKTRRFECSFESRDGNLEVMLSQLAELHALLNRFTALVEVVISFHPEDAPYANLSGYDVTAWVKAMEKLLNTIIEKGCTSLHVNGLRQMCDIYHCTPLFPRQPPLSIKLLSLWDSAISTISRLRLPSPAANEESRHLYEDTVLRGPTWEYRRDHARPATHPNRQNDETLTYLSPAAKVNTQLTHMTIGSNALLFPPLLQWTYLALECSPISTLTIRNVDFVGPTWSILSTLLPRARPSLRRLELSNVGSVSHEQITHFMAAFPELKYLSAEGLGLPWYTFLSASGLPAGIAMPVFACLGELRVQSNWILPNIEFDAKTFPALKRLTIAFDGNTTAWMGATSPLPNLSKRSDELPFEVNVEIGASCDIVPWMKRTRLPDIRQGQEMFRCVSGVVLVVHGRLEWEHEPNENAVRMVAGEWFGQFPMLRKGGIRIQAENVEMEIERAERFCRQGLPTVLEKLERFDIDARPARIRLN
ncbi:hypothetical protein NMY22_g14762 [Coprinellus aureogranulatus]|nr:hypothetical protein NMY22_g14762 [Coprinellus aureogranulatus]